MREILVAIFHHSNKDDLDRVLLEMAYTASATTALMNMATDAGWKAVEGIEALIWQGIEQFKIWTGINPIYADARAAVFGQ
jgi:pentafunctional AROM polypeptide